MRTLRRQRSWCLDAEKELRLPVQVCFQRNIWMFSAAGERVKMSKLRKVQGILLQNPLETWGADQMQTSKSMSQMWTMLTTLLPVEMMKNQIRYFSVKRYNNFTFYWHLCCSDSEWNWIVLFDSCWWEGCCWEGHLGTWVWVIEGKPVVLCSW